MHTLAQGRFSFSSLFVVINNHFSGIKSPIYLIQLLHAQTVTEMMMSIDICCLVNYIVIILFNAVMID